MTSTVVKKENSVVTLRVTLSAEEFESAMERAFQRQKNMFNIPGFRRGKAPMNLVLRTYGEGILYEDATSILLPDALNKAIKEHDLDWVGTPDVDIESIGRGRELVAVFEVTVKPDVTLGRYKGVEAVKPELSFDPQQVDAEIARVRDRNSRLVSIDDRAAEDGDTVTIDYVGEKDGVAFEGGSAEDAELVLGSGSFIPGFEEQVIGHEIGDEFDVEVTFPEDYHSEDLKGAAAVFHVTLHAIRRKELPDLDDDFAMDVSEFDTMDEYRESIREKLMKEAEEQARTVFENNVIQAVTAEAAVDIPNVMIEEQIDRMVDQQAGYYERMGIAFEDFLKYTNQTEREFRDRFRVQAEANVRTSLVLEAIVAAENIEADENDVQRELERVASQYKQNADELLETVPEENREGLMNHLKSQAVLRRAVDLIRDSAFAVAEPEPVAVEMPAAGEAASGTGEETGADD
ncbi:MAG: trigger factor [Bacillota bacterium]|nr:trigger factor [Bacillota bacterium]